MFLPKNLYFAPFILWHLKFVRNENSPFQGCHRQTIYIYIIYIFLILVFYSVSMILTISAGICEVIWNVIRH